VPIKDRVEPLTRSSSSARVIDPVKVECNRRIAILHVILKFANPVITTGRPVVVRLSANRVSKVLQSHRVTIDFTKTKSDPTAAV